MTPTTSGSRPRPVRPAVVVAPLSEYRRTVPGPPGLVIGYATPSTSDLHRALTILTEILSRR